MNITYNNKSIIVTGGGSGIGKSIALMFAEAGAAVYILDHDKEAGKAVCKEIESRNQQCRFFLCDVADQQEVQQVINKIGKQQDRIDVLINNAGIAHIGSLHTTTEEDMDRIYEVNVKGVYNCMYAVIEQMVEQGGGVILNMASVVSTVGIADRFAYSMSKGAVLTMTLSVAKDYISDNIRCNCISPGRVHTPFVDGFLRKNYPGREEEMFEELSKTQPIGRMGKPEEIAALVLYLCSDQAAFITGANYPIDGGFDTLNS